MAIIKIICKNPAGSNYDEKYKDDFAIPNVVSYVLNPQKTQGFIGGWSVDPNNAVEEIELFQRLCHKDNGLRIRHWTVSFTAYEINCIVERLQCDSGRLLWNIGGLLAEYYKDRYQIVWGVHLDKPDNPHIHFAMSTVSFFDGKKYGGTIAEYSDYIAHVKRVLRYYGINVWPLSDRADEKHIHTY